MFDRMIAAGLAASTIAKHQGFVAPVFFGADPALELLQHISGQLDQIEQAKASGQQTDPAQEQQLKEQKEQLEAAISSKTPASTPPASPFTMKMPERQAGESDEAYYRRFHQEVTERAAVRSDVTEALKVALSAQEEKAARQKRYALEAVNEILGTDGDIKTAVERVLTHHRGGSRFAGHGASEGFVSQFGALAVDDDEFGEKGFELGHGVVPGWERTGVDATAYGGAGYGVLDNGKAMRVGADRELEFLRKQAAPKEKGGAGLGMGQYITLINKSKFGQLMSETERRWFDHLRTKALAEGTPSAGGVLVPREYMADLLGLLRAQAVVRRAAPRIQRFNREMYQTSVSSGATAFYTQENAQIPVSEETFAEAPLLTPKNLTALVPVSNYLLNDAEAADDFVRADLAEVLALREDLAFLRGTGTLGEPRGLRNISGITLDPITPGASGVQLTLAQIRRIRAVFRSLNAGAVRPVWFFNPEFLTYLETLQEMSGGSPTGRTLLDAETISYDDDTMTSGRFDGVRFFSTTQLPNGTTGGNPTTELYLVNMAETIVGENQELEIDVSREASYWDGAAWVSAFQNNQSVFRAVMRHDIAHRRPNQIIVQTGARTT